MPGPAETADQVVGLDLDQPGRDEPAGTSPASGSALPAPPTAPPCGRGYPERTVAQLGWSHAEVLAGDLDLIAAPIDVLGVNCYTRQVVRGGDAIVDVPAPATAMGWEIHPSSLGTLLRDLHEQYRFPLDRIPKASALRYQDVCRTGTVSLPG